MEAQLKSLLHQIYASPMQQPQQQQQTAGGLPQEDRTRTLSTDEFRMFVYKVVPCTRRGPHSWVECAFCHPGEKASRRCPTKCPYAPLACPALKKDGHCPQGDNCLFAHNLFEYWLHPSRYRTQLCSYGIECKRSICFFAHHPGELRVGEHTAQLLALEKELEGNDPTYAASNAKWGINNTQPQQVNRQRQQHQQQQQHDAGRNFQHPTHLSQQQQQQQRRMHHHPQGPAGMDAAQMAQLRHLQALQGSGSLPPAAMLNYQSLQANGMPHANPAAAAAALLEAALQPQPPYPISMSPALASRSALQHEGQMASAMKLLSDMSLARGSATGGMPEHNTRLQSYGSMPIFQQQQQQQHLQPQHSLNSSSNDTLQALQLISQLQQLAGRASNGAGGPNGDNANSLQTVLLNSLPQLLMQLSGGIPAQMAPAAPPPPPPSGLAPKAPLPPILEPQPPKAAATAAAEDSAFFSSSLKCPPSKASSGSPSPANALSIRTRRTGDSSCSSQVSDGTRSPPLSHHSDEGIWAVRDEDKDRWARRPSGSSAPEIVKDYLPDAGPFANLSCFHGLEDATRELAASAPSKHLLPHSLDDADLASGMADMSGASAMIASLSQLIDCPSPLQA